MESVVDRHKSACIAVKSVVPDLLGFLKKGKKEK